MSVVVCMEEMALSASVFSPVREMPGLEIAFSNEVVWLQCQKGDSTDLQRLSAMPHSLVYHLGDELQLVPLGCRLPTARLPESLSWSSLKSWLDLRFPVAALPGKVDSSARVALELKRGLSGKVEPNLLLTTLSDVNAYVDRAAEVRMKGLSFAVSGDGQALVSGSPLPPVRGTYFYLESGLAIPLGYKLSLPVGGEVVRQALRLSKGEFAVMHEDRSIDRLCRDDFVALTRNAVRLTLARLAASQSEEAFE